MARFTIASRRSFLASRTFPGVGWFVSSTISWRSTMLWSATAQSSSAFSWAFSRFCDRVVWFYSDWSLTFLCNFYIWFWCYSVSTSYRYSDFTEINTSSPEWRGCDQAVWDPDVAWTVPASLWQSVFHHTQSGPYDETMGSQECAHRFLRIRGGQLSAYGVIQTLTNTNIRIIAQIGSRRLAGCNTPWYFLIKELLRLMKANTDESW